MTLIPEWRQAWRMFSVHCMSAAAALLSTWQALPDDLRAAVPQPWVLWLAVALMVLGVVGRLIDQPSIQSPAQPPEVAQ